MDIITAHRHGLIEQLEEEVAALAGRGRDHVQRAIVLHHLFDHSRGSHCWALLEARRELRIAVGLATLRRRLARWGWLRAKRERAEAALDQLAEALGEASRSRTAFAYRAYRLSSAPALREEAEASLDQALLALLDQCHAARRAAVSLGPEAKKAIIDQCEHWVAKVVDGQSVRLAWEAIAATGLKRAASRVVGDKALARLMAKDQRRDAAKIERQLRDDDLFPPGFRANPAQTFYALQRMLLERRRQQWREACDREADAFELAA
jgi:hypothetical protein